MENEYLLLIDGSSLLTTQFYGNLPTQVMFAKTPEEKEKYYFKIMQTSKGVYTNAVYGFMRALVKMIREQKPTHIAVAWDLSRNTFRRQLYPEYKGNRGETPKPLSEQFALCMDVLKRIGIKQFMDENYEADDFCGTLAKRFEGELPVKIITKDRDYLQLVNDRTNLWMMHSTAKKTEELYEKYGLKVSDSVPERCINLTNELVKAEYGVEPCSVADLKGIQGDSADNIKGVPGVGEATALILIQKYGTLEALYDELSGLDEKGLKALAASWKELGINRSPIAALMKTGEGLVGKEAAFLSRRLATIKCDVPLGELKLSDLALKVDRDEAQKAFTELEFKSLKADFGSTVQKEEEKIETAVLSDISIAFDEIYKLAGKEKLLGAALLEEKDELTGIAFVSNEHKGIMLEISGFVTDSFAGGLCTDLCKKGVKLVVWDAKKLYKSLDIETLTNVFDVSLAEYLTDPLKGDRPEPRPLGEPYEAAFKLAGELLLSYQRLSALLKEQETEKLYYEIELPLVTVLAAMERNGIRVSEKILKDFSQKLEEDIQKLTQKIYDSAGEEFNINSPKQLGVILFEKLKLPYGKKTKTGYSTSAEILDYLKDEYPIVQDILEFRQLSKLKSTYADGLREVICADGRIRTTFNQKVTATGRLSSTEPNLQNIPIRTELGRYLRKAFIPEEGCCFIDADYSQIELRILASLSKDEKLISAYTNSEDIHRSTAAAVFSVPYEEVTKELRSRAKAVNFGIVYGISSFGLSNDIGIDIKEAEQYINKYFETYPSIRSYLNGLVDFAQKEGYSVTYFGRRRPIPELTLANYNQRQFGERIAMNSPIQGTAADVIKIAMIRVYNRLKEEAPKAKLLLQVHDELLVEAPKEECELVKKIMEEEMVASCSLPVKLEVGIESGSDWFEAH